MKQKRELVYWGIGAALAAALLTYAIIGLRFLVRELNVALNPNLIKPAEVVRFNLNKMKELNIPGIQ